MLFCSFLGSIKRIVSDGYVPTVQDIHAAASDNISKTLGSR